MDSIKIIDQPFKDKDTPHRTFVNLKLSDIAITYLHAAIAYYEDTEKPKSIVVGHEVKNIIHEIWKTMRPS